MASSLLNSFRLNTDEGWLPAWLLIVSVISTANSLQSYLSPSYHQQLYIGSSRNPSPSAPLAARTFGTWTFLSSVVRAYAAYNIHNPVAYDMAFWTYGIALGHFLTEVVVYGSAQVRGRFVFPLVFASSALVWMGSQRGYYLS
ncbi:ergosterol biosynthesis protein Erg28, putative [Talaromyces stipitatus ATCC 10500]|uniref:Ergosterol biosynthesis protein Erg28, putative n=1 Tax=Talaromyces stipitatus (strain ATCC 10500 / CBS 375.48 / QM 6759 / NRRL 1006) TaxID=441959 RepID=B8M3U3_TALSN|nr:ergosterol biosynthesis protein Erg28, putative [Talaromyces stipitatus ATCC 10500]EED20686.1 ergosterol biosynthesis protein Erg28, putative [Talaromyces stipitatus ATCC 10500]